MPVPRAMSLRNLTWREAVIPILAATGLTLWIQDIFLSDTLRARLLGPRLAGATAGATGLVCGLVGVGLTLLLGCCGFKSARWRGGRERMSEAARRLWPLTILNVLLVMDPSAYLSHGHLYLGVFCVGLTLWRPGGLCPSPGNALPEGALSLRHVPVAVYAAAGTYFAVFLAMAWLQYASLNLQPVDFYSAEQRMWNALQGDFFRSDNTPRSFLAEHIMLLDVAVLPIYALWPGIPILLMVHVALAAISCIPVWLLAAETLRRREVATAFAVAFLLHPGLHHANLEISGAAYNPLLYALPFLAWGLLFLERGWYRCWAVCSVPAILVKEDITVLIFTEGLIVALGRGIRPAGARRLGAAMAAGSLAWLLLCLRVFIPHFFSGQESHGFQHYTELGRSSSEIVLRILREPWIVPQRVLTPQNLEFLAQMFLPYGFLGLLDPRTLFFAAPTYGYLMLSNTTYEATHSIFFYYHIPLLPFAAAGSIRSLRRITERARRQDAGDPESRGSGSWSGPVAYLAAGTLAATLVLSKTPLSLSFYDPAQPMAYYGSMYVVPERAGVVREIQKLIPRDKVVGASEHLVLFFTHWKHCYIHVPPHAHPVDYLVFDLQDKWRRIYSPDSSPPHLGYLAGGEFEEIFHQEDFVVLRRRAPPSGQAGKGVE
ncbi:MAG: DUF2079 domain-containing protein [Planctomycetes bacterium]|nr:DUF2079 domain-containing protein [Planctomycetota bacterium]